MYFQKDSEIIALLVLSPAIFKNGRFLLIYLRQNSFSLSKELWEQAFYISVLSKVDVVLFYDNNGKIHS